MPGNTEEKEKCLEKLNQMQKFIPFLDFMIEKISKKNNELSLECQLSKLQILRSMIAEKSEKYSWEVIIKVEDVIQRLISMLDIKDGYEKSKEKLDSTDSQNCKTSMATSISLVPSSTTTVSVTTTSNSQSTAVGVKPQHGSTSAVDLIMKTLKTQVDNNLKTITERGKELSNPLGPNQPLDISVKPMETDLDKDLDGYDLTDCPDLSETGSSNTAFKEVPEKVSSHDDLLSSSREKLLKSLQSRLFPCKTNVPTPQSPAVDKTEKNSEPQNCSASSRGQKYVSDQKAKSGFSEVTATATSEMIPGKIFSFAWKNKSVTRSDETSTTAVKNPVVSTKQKLKEKLSTDICEVYRVPGKSVGGSLRSLKESKDHRKSLGEGELFKPEIIYEKGFTKGSSSLSRLSAQCKDSPNGKSYRDPLSSLSDKKGERSNDKAPHKHSTNHSGNDKRLDSQNSRTGKSDFKSRNHNNESVKGDTAQEKKLDNKCSKGDNKSVSKKVEGKNFELDKLNDEELLAFVKENMQSLPHLAKLKSSELREAVQSSLLSNFSALDADVSEISDDSFHELDDVTSGGSNVKTRTDAKDKTENKATLHPLASVKVTQVGPDGVAKNVKPIVEPSKSTKILEEIGDKTYDLDDVSYDSPAEEEDYAMKLIEETTAKAYPSTVKKGLLELPMPATDDLFDEISSIGSFEPLSSPSENRDPRLAKLSENKSKLINKSESKSPDASKSANDIWSTRPAASLPKDNNQSSRPHSIFPVVNAPTDQYKRCGQDRSDPLLGKNFVTRGLQDVNHYPLSNNRYPHEGIDYNARYLINAAHSNPRRPAYLSSEPKSYAEYKRLKKKEQEKMRLELSLQEGTVSSVPDGADACSRSFSEKGDVDKNPSKKTQDALHSGYKDSTTKQNKSHPPVRTFDGRKNHPYSKQWRHTDQKDSRERRSNIEETRKEDDEKAKKGDDTRHSSESDELVSPLEELYRGEAKPKTGRGYGIQNFKIPKKVQKPFSQGSSKPDKSRFRTNNEIRSDPKTEVSNVQSELDSTKRVTESVRGEEPEKSEISEVNVADRTTDSVEGAKKSVDQSESGDTTVVDSTVTVDVPSKSTEKVESSVDCAKTDSSIIESDTVIRDLADSCEKTKANENPKSDSVTVSEDKILKDPKIEPKDSVKTDTFEQTSDQKSDAQNKMVTITESKAVSQKKTKCEAEMVECDSSVELTSFAEKNSEKHSATSNDKSTVVQKEEITQEFVEALIRKSFQSGEGKLLLAQVKLFEEFARKLNSKKLKTIQKIINSESGSSSSSSESSSEDEKKKLRSKKSEQKNKKRKKKGRRNRKHKFSSSSSWSESEESSEEDSCDKKVKTKRNESPPDTPSTSEETKASVKAKGSKRCLRRRSKQIQNQNNLLESILNESPQGEDSNGGNPVDGDAKEPEPKRKGGRMKGRTKTELDRLHDDIRSMFISAGVVTATGQRMCRILKQSGGNMNDVDIVKESAKMVEEEKLKKVQTRTARNLRPVNAGITEKGTKAQLEYDEEDPKLNLVPCVALQRVDLNNFGYAVKVSEDCISFRRMRGRNTAIRSAGLKLSQKDFDSYSLSNPARNVFLARNKRKFERLRDSKCKKGYAGKNLMDIIKNLPLKMAKMRHLQIYEKKKEESNKTVEELIREAEPEKMERAVDLSDSELQNYAFEKKRKVYICKLCSHITRNITSHFKEVHPEYEVLISRLSVTEAESAKIESEKNNYEITSTAKNSLGNAMKRKGKPLNNRSITYHCRMCCFSKVGDVNSFAAHVSTHTGEYRYQCPAEGCFVRVHSREAIKLHILAKHHKIRYELYNKIIQVYPLTIEGNTLFGYLCSLCHYIQIRLCNLEKHLAIQHNSSKDARIIKINLTLSKKKPPKKRPGKSKNDSEEASSVCWNNFDSDDEENRKSDTKTDLQEERNKNADETKDVDVKNKKRKQKSDSSTESDEFDTERIKSKKIFLDESAEVVEVVKQSKCNEEPLVEDAIDVEENDDNLDDIDMEDCVDLKSITSLKGSDIICSMETPEANENPTGSKTESTVCKLKVGPIAAVLSPDSEVLYECYVKGCLFSTRALNLFEKHIKISHWKTKWNGVCSICCAGKKIVQTSQNSFKLLTALNHLKLHARGRSGGGKLSAEDLIMELKLLSPSEKCIVDDEDSNSAHGEGKEIKKVVEQMGENSENSETPYPAKPLLRVRNLIGDRLSTPKADETEIVAINEDESSNPDSSTDSSKMFTIENVRSLTDSPTGEDSELKIEQVCSLKDLVSKQNSGKPIIVRSCPTRKIAIRPEPSPLSVDIGTINVVQPPVVGQPVVISPLSSTSPIRIISASLSPKPSFAVKPLVVSADSVRLNTPNLMPVVRPSVSPTVTTTAILPLGTNENFRVNTDVKAVPQKSNSQESKSGGAEDLLASKIGLDVEVIKSSTRSKSPATSSGTVQHGSKNSSSDVDDPDEKDAISPQKFGSSPNTGKKSVKHAKIYKEMLTKTKLCHLFKCMGIECSFTCNNENVFAQHIGLHEAQSRLKRNKGLKTNDLRLANKRAFYWQQCAYCCEVLSNTNKGLSHHILEEHGHCMYQCAFCFYRAVSHCYVEIHQNLAHSQILKTTPRVIYKCKPLKVPPSQAVALEKHGRKQSVRPYHCDQCGRKFYITHEFTSHLQSEHQSVTAYTCHICKNFCFKINRLINHYKLHSYSTYQCAYCLHGTETEKEMVFHLCNFHFSQPAVMYVRAMAEGQSGGEKQKLNKKKKQLSNQLDSLNVIIYEGENPNLDCIVEADPDEEIPENVSESSLDLSSIVAELGIYTDSQSSAGNIPTPLMKELASIGNKSAKHLTVKTLLPNAQFSSENENGAENCSVLISSGLSVPSDANNEREMSIPLGQLPLEAVNIQHKETPAPSTTHPNNIGSPDRNLKLNEIIVNLQQKDKNLTVSAVEEEKAGQSAVKHSSAVHKLPPVVLGRSSALKSAYPVAKKKCDESQGSGNTEGNKNCSEKSTNGKEGKAGQDKTASASKNVDAGSRKPSTEKQTEEGSEDTATDHPLIMNVVSLSNSEFDKEESIIISDVCSLCTPSVEGKEKTGSGIVVNIKSAISVASVLKPPIIRVEDFPIEKKMETDSNENIPTVENKESGEVIKKECEKSQEDRPPSPDIIILENEKGKDIVTVTLDSDDEKEENSKKKTEEDLKDSKVGKSSAGNETIRKEMELLRKQIANETDSLLLDEPEAEKPSRDLTLKIQESKKDEDPNEKTLLSPIEEAICSLNKKLESESQEAQKKEEEEKKEKVEETPRKADANENKVPERPRTRFGVRKGVTESAEKSNVDDGGNKKDSVPKCKKFKGELMGKELFICGNEKCNFAADDDSALKDHLYVCDLSRESSVLVCPHCSRQMKHFRPYLEHLKYHGEKKFHCGLCSFSSAVDSSVSSHLKQKHKFSVTKILPKDSKEGHFVYYPKNYKVEKIDFEVNGYSPGDEDKLPLQSVYQVNVKCAKCPYFTKVRSNMVRHLKIHVKSVETEGVVVVPSTAPTNPVPCLETKERMFDKMTNLAASSQLAQAKEKTAVESLSPEEEAKLPQFVAEQMRYKCCLPDCNYITVDDGMLKHHIKALHDEVSYYSCPHCRSTVHVDVRHVTLDKIGFHLKHHDAKLYKCAHCIYFHYQKNVVDKHTVEKHPDRRYFVHVVREPKLEITSEEEAPNNEGGARVWKCGVCEDFQTPSKSTLMDHLLKTHNSKSKFKCRLCSMKGNSYQVFSGHFASKHPGEKVSYLKMYYSDKAASGQLESQSGNSSGADSSNEHFDTTPLWQRGAPRIRHIRGILIEEEEIKTKKSKKTNACETDAESSNSVTVNENAFYCPLCTNKKKPFYTRNEDCFRSHLYQELNYQQFACILCGKMFVDRKDFEKHHSRIHADKPQSLKQTKEDHEIMFWVDQVIAKQRKQMEERKRKLSDAEASGNEGPPKKKKEV